MFGPMFSPMVSPKTGRLHGRDASRLFCCRPLLPGGARTAERCNAQTIPGRGQHRDHRARFGQRVIHRSAQKRVNPCSLRQCRAQNISCFLVKSDPASHEETIPGFENATL
jgi:hypothetical protein